MQGELALHPLLLDPRADACDRQDPPCPAGPLTGPWGLESSMALALPGTLLWGLFPPCLGRATASAIPAGGMDAPPPLPA